MTLDGLPKPDADLFISDWIGDSDPTFILSVLTSGQIGAWNDTGWTSDEYDSLFAQQAAALDETERTSLVDQMQQMAYDASPYAMIAYPQTLEAERTDRWQGWVQAPAGTGSALITADNIDTYLYVRPKPAAEPAPAAMPWWVWPALAGACLAGATVVWAASKAVSWWKARQAAAEAARRPRVRRVKRPASAGPVGGRRRRVAVAGSACAHRPCRRLPAGTHRPWGPFVNARPKLVAVFLLLLVAALAAWLPAGARAIVERRGQAAAGPRMRAARFGRAERKSSGVPVTRTV